jgi:hypothetical protein
MPKDGLPTGSRNIHDRTHFAHGFRDSDEHRAADDGMANVQLLDLGDGGDWTDVARGESVPRMDGEPTIGSEARRRLEGAKDWEIVGMVSVAARVELDRDGAEVARPVHGIRLGIDEEARANAGRSEPLDRCTQRPGIASDVQAPFSRHLFAAFGHERDLVWAESLSDRDHFGGARHFEVQHRPNCSRQAFYVVVLDVSAIFAQVSGDTVRASVLAFDCGEDGVGFDGSACLAKRRDVVDVNVKSLVHGS